VAQVIETRLKGRKMIIMLIKSIVISLVACFGVVFIVEVATQLYCFYLDIQERKKIRKARKNGKRPKHVKL